MLVSHIQGIIAHLMYCIAMIYGSLLFNYDGKFVFHVDIVTTSNLLNSKMYHQTKTFLFFSLKRKKRVNIMLKLRDSFGFLCRTVYKEIYDKSDDSRAAKWPKKPSGRAILYIYSISESCFILFKIIKRKTKKKKSDLSGRIINP